MRPITHYLTRPARLIRDYQLSDLRPDLIAGITVVVILLPQAIAFALLAELPAKMGIYTAAIAAIFGALWGSSHQSHTGPTNAISILVLSVLLTSYKPGSPEYLLAAGILAVMVGVFQLILGLARLGMLVNFVSHSVVVGFATGAGVLIAIRQLPHLLGIDLYTHNAAETLLRSAESLSEVDHQTALIGFGTVTLLIVLRRLSKRVPAALIGMAIASVMVYLLDLQEVVEVIGELPRQLPPLANLPLFNSDFITQLSSGALAVGAIGLVETTAISRSIANETGQRLDSNQEFVGQGLANIAAGLFSGYPSAGSFSRSAVNFNAGARSSLAAVFSSLFVVAGMFFLAPMAAFLPRAALAGVLVVVALGMINGSEIKRIWQGTRGDALIMVVTLAGTLFIEIAFAVLAGILLSFVLYILRTSVPRVQQVVPDEDHKHFAYRPDRPVCPQLGVIDILGDLYFGAVNHIEETIHGYAEQQPDQRYLLIRMHNVNHCDFSGIHMLESILRLYRDRGGDVYLVQVSYPVDKLMNSTGFCNKLGKENFLEQDTAVSQIFYRVLDPAVCIYECPVRVFSECRNLPKQLYLDEVSQAGKLHSKESAEEVAPQELYDEISAGKKSITIIDVREPREYRRGHIPQATLIPLPKILSGKHQFATAGEHEIVLACRTGRRSRLAARYLLNEKNKVRIVKGGMLAWEAAGLLTALEL